MRSWPRLMPVGWGDWAAPPRRRAGSVDPWRAGVNVDLHFGIGNWMGCYHWIPAGEMFEGLPAGGLAGEAYADVSPHYVMSELGGRVFAGSSLEHADAARGARYDLVQRYRGDPVRQREALFCQYRPRSGREQS